MLTREDGTILQANATFCTWVGHAATELQGRRIQDLLTMGGRIFHQTHWAPLLRMQGSVSEVKLEVVARDGTTIPMVVNAIRREVAGATVHELAAFVARDRDKYERELVSSRKRLQELVAEATRLHAEAKDRALVAEQMVGIVSHDLRNPLTGIAMGAALLLRGELSESQQRTLSRIMRSTERANRLIADLLDFTQARLGTGLPVSLTTIDLHATIAEAVEELTLAYPNRALVHQFEGDGPCIADAGRLAQLVGNLVSNAVAYGTPQSPVTVISRIEPASFSVSVHNSGPPIPPATRSEIFQPLKRGSGASNAGRSIGLGLFIVREIAKAHAGSTDVQSSADHGTTFSAVFPRTREPAVQT
jgi:sigma-B regulation protein RsbU (phosphoserine phosphatase)